ncbi:MAG: hypothetical protein E7355_00010 [Clostridiales bacterium]|nr:hypothetical protein [Clostridiales bacterium]
MLAFTMVFGMVGCNNKGVNADKGDNLSSGGGSSSGSGSLSDYESGNTVGGNTGGSTGDYETEDKVNGGTSGGNTGDYETENTPTTTPPSGSLDDYVGGELADLPSSLIDDEYRTKDGYSYFYHHQHSPTTMPIAAWVAPPPPCNTSIGNFTTNQITLENYKTLAESGINTIYGLYDIILGPNSASNPNVSNALRWANATDLVYYVRDTGLLNNLNQSGASVIENECSWYMNQAAYGGTLTSDEPGIGNPETPFNKYKVAREAWNQTKYKGIKNMYVNHLPSYASKNQLYYGAGMTGSEPSIDFTGKNWGNFVKAYVETVKPDMYSYDFYPFREGKAQFADYYFSLSTARREAAAGNIPFWVFCQVGYFDHVSTLSEAQMRIQVSTALAYGAKGVQWFCYWLPLEFSPKYTAGLVDHFGVKTLYYPMVQKINKQVKAAGEILMQCKNMGVIQIGNSYDTIPTGDLLTTYGAVTSTSGSTGDAIIGCFEYRNTGKSVYYVASNNFDVGTTVKLTFDKAYNVSVIQNATETKASNQSSIELQIAAGDGALVVVG